MITLTQMRRFLAVAEMKNFHAAAERVYITQPALSQSIQKLEESIGEPLFYRSTRGVELTEAGKLLVPRARLIVKFSDDFLHDVEELKGRRMGHIHLGVAPYFARDLFPAAFSAFAKRWQNVTVDVVEGQTIELVHAVEEGKLDMALCGLYDDPEKVTAMEFLPLCTEHYSLYARRGHPLLNKKADTPARLSEFPWAVVDRKLYADSYPASLTASGLPLPNFAFESHSLHVLISVICATDYIGMLPDGFARPEVKAGRVQIIKTDVFDMNIHGGVFMHPEAPRSSALNELILALQQAGKDRAH